MLKSLKDIWKALWQGKNIKLGARSKDIAIPSSLLSRIGLDFHIIDPYISIDEEFLGLYTIVCRFKSYYVR